tara:strand:- start:330 stop:602 length:273 start_codon:yes stop_codon:yes gene_type:complete
VVLVQAMTEVMGVIQYFPALPQLAVVKAVQRRVVLRMVVTVVLAVVPVAAEALADREQEARVMTVVMGKGKQAISYQVVVEVLVLLVVIM